MALIPKFREGVMPSLLLPLQPQMQLLNSQREKKGKGGGRQDDSDDERSYGEDATRFARTRCRNPPARVIFIPLGLNLQRHWSIWHVASAFQRTWTYVGPHPKETYRSSWWIFASFSVSESLSSSTPSPL
ncbi:hypothetical protein HNY73_019724 [Argiope bruennichi]|uniref:Uncharacterized protein n=1 Tax=Argiope bruennichi TaxID=94029 RepID=A0A8T0E4H9_ARGBR|nr:hypothetical protein HNY73_019724 [Argiope bruennichi]